MGVALQKHTTWAAPPPFELIAALTFQAQVCITVSRSGY